MLGEKQNIFQKLVIRNIGVNLDHGDPNLPCVREYKIILGECRGEEALKAIRCLNDIKNK